MYTCQAHIMPRVIFVIFYFLLIFFILKKFTCQANIMPRVRVSFLYSIWSQYSL